MRINLWHVIWFFLKFLMVFCVLIVPQWSVLGRGYSAAYCTVANWFLSSFGDDGAVHYETVREVQARIDYLMDLQARGQGSTYAALSSASGLPVAEIKRMKDMSENLARQKADMDWDVVMYLQNTRTGASMISFGSSRFKGFLPTAFVASLIVATPIPWWRRLTALLWGVPLVSVFVGLRLYIALLHIFTRPAAELNDVRLAVYQPPEWIRSFITYLKLVFDTSFAGCFVLAGCIWFLVCFRRSDLAELLPSRADNAEVPAESGPRAPA